MHRTWGPSARELQSLDSRGTLSLPASNSREKRRTATKQTLIQNADSEDVRYWEMQETRCDALIQVQSEEKNESRAGPDTVPYAADKTEGGGKDAMQYPLLSPAKEGKSSEQDRSGNLNDKKRNWHKSALRSLKSPADTKDNGSKAKPCVRSLILNKHCELERDAMRFYLLEVSC